MNIKIRDREEYIGMKADFKRESIKIKNKNIHLTAVLKKMIKKDPRFSIVDSAVKFFLKRMGYKLKNYSLDEKIEEMFDSISHINPKKVKLYEDEIFKICKQVVKVLELGVHDVYEYIRFALNRYADRHDFNEKCAGIRKFMADMIRGRVRDAKKATCESAVKARQAVRTIGMWNISTRNTLLNMTKALSREINSLYKYIVQPENDDNLKNTFYDDDASSFDNSIIRLQIEKIQDNYKVNTLNAL